MSPPEGEFSTETANGRTTTTAKTQDGRERGDGGSIKPTKSLLAKTKSLWARTGITAPVAKLILKGALAPTIVIAAYQSDAWANQYSTLGYLVGVVTQLSLVVQPRSKFLQTMLVQVLLICLGAALAVLACFCAVQARLHTEGYSGPGTGGPGTSGTASTGAQTATYNSSASAVSGVWLFFEIYAISAFRAKFPQYTIPSILFSIMANISLVYAPQFSTMAQAEAFVLNLLSAFLTGFAVASGVSLLVFPVTNRQLVFNDMSTLISNMRGALTANMTYLRSLETTDMFSAQRTNTAGEHPPRSPEAEAFLAKMRAVSATHSKCAINLPFAKREVALGKLGPDDLQQIFKLLRELSIPMVGLSCLSEIFERISEERGWDRRKSFPEADMNRATNEAEKARIESINEWHELIRLLKEPFTNLSEVIDEGLQHIAMTLQFTKATNGSGPAPDAEAGGDHPRPGDATFAAYLDRRTEDFDKSKQVMLRGWCRIHNIELPDGVFSSPSTHRIELPAWMNEKPTPDRVRLRRQLMILLYVDFLLYNLSRRTYNLVKYADQLKTNGKLSKTRLILPGFKRLRKWAYGALHEQDADKDEYSESLAVYLGQGFKKRKDPDHLPPRNAWQRYSNVFRTLAHFFGSPASLFAFRSAAATMSVAIINYLGPTQAFFTKERLFWAQIMTSIAMAPSAGQSLRTFFLRVIGTVIAMLMAMIAWYIVDERTAGILVFYFLFQLPGLYVMIKHPPITPVGLIATITLTLVIGYELQVRKIGVAKAVSNGQEYYPGYELAPIRLATVVAGLFVAWIFTIFPYPITEHSQLRKSLANTLYILTSYYTTVDETVKIRLQGMEKNTEVKGSPSQKLAKTRLNLFSKCNLLLNSMRSQANFVKYDIPVGGAFPKAQYEAMIERVQSILNFIVLISVASATFSNVDEGDQNSNHEWARSLRKLLGAVDTTTQSVTSLLALFSASLGHGQPLPPFLNCPPSLAIAEQMDQMDSELLSVKHIAEPGYASFAVINIAWACMLDDLQELLNEVREIVGELDFSFHNTNSHQHNGDDSTPVGSEEDRSKQD